MAKTIYDLASALGVEPHVIYSRLKRITVSTGENPFSRGYCINEYAKTFIATFREEIEALRVERAASEIDYGDPEDQIRQQAAHYQAMVVGSEIVDGVPLSLPKGEPVFDLHGLTFIQRGSFFHCEQDPIHPFVGRQAGYSPLALTSRDTLHIYGSAPLAKAFVRLNGVPVQLGTLQSGGFYEAKLSKEAFQHLLGIPRPGYPQRRMRPTLQPERT